MESPGCYICGATINPEDGSPVLWKCQGCDRTICRKHTKTTSDGLQFLETTLCSPDPDTVIVEKIHEENCWENAGRPDE
jgi:hypothetical protein